MFNVPLFWITINGALSSPTNVVFVAILSVFGAELPPFIFTFPNVRFPPSNNINAPVNDEPRLIVTDPSTSKSNVVFIVTLPVTKIVPPSFTKANALSNVFTGLVDVPAFESEPLVPFT